MDKENMLRTVLRNEFTWVFLIAGTLYGIVATVILPLNALQIQVAQIQSDISNLKTFDSRITENANNIIVLQQQLKSVVPQVTGLLQRE